MPMMKRLLTILCIPTFLLLGAAEAGSADLQKGKYAYDTGDYAAALREWRPLAEQGDAKAQYNLGVMYAKGEGVAQDYAQAAEWYNLAAAQGVENGAKWRDKVADKMTPDQVAEAQRLAREWMKKHSK